MQADQANFEDWEEQMVVDRSRGQFFKNLYKAEQKPPKEAAKGALRDPRVRGRGPGHTEDENEGC